MYVDLYNIYVTSGLLVSFVMFKTFQSSLRIALIGFREVLSTIRHFSPVVLFNSLTRSCFMRFSKQLQAKKTACSYF